MSEAKAKKQNALLKRVVFGALYAVTVIACLYGGVIPTAIIVAIMACLCCRELLRMCHGAGRMPNDIIALVATSLYPLAPLLPYDDAVMVSTILLLAACAVWYVATPRTTIVDVAITAFAPLYCGFAFSSVTLIRACDPGIKGFLLTFGVMGSIWLNDSMAYFVGSRFGRTKLAPRISPNKSYEGFWGGLAGCVFIWILLVILHVRSLKIYFAIPVGMAVGVMSVLGDLFESRIKRGFGVKDSGDILPGHGGMLDRSDALLFGCMTAFLLLRLGRIV